MDKRSTGVVVKGYALVEGDSLIECPVSNSWSFLISVPNMATGVGYQDGGRVSTVCLIMCCRISALLYVSHRAFT